MTILPKIDGPFGESTRARVGFGFGPSDAPVTGADDGSWTTVQHGKVHAPVTGADYHNMDSSQDFPGDGYGFTDCFEPEEMTAYDRALEFAYNHGFYMDDKGRMLKDPEPGRFSVYSWLQDDGNLVLSRKPFDFEEEDAQTTAVPVKSTEPAWVSPVKEKVPEKVPVELKYTVVSYDPIKLHAGIYVATTTDADNNEQKWFHSPETGTVLPFSTGRLKTRLTGNSRAIVDICTAIGVTPGGKKQICYAFQPFGAVEKHCLGGAMGLGQTGCLCAKINATKDSFTFADHMPVPTCQETGDVVAAIKAYNQESESEDEAEVEQTFVAPSVPLPPPKSEFEVFRDELILLIPQMFSFVERYESIVQGEIMKKISGLAHLLESRLMASRYGRGAEKLEAVLHLSIILATWESRNMSVSDNFKEQVTKIGRRVLLCHKNFSNVEWNSSVDDVKEMLRWKVRKPVCRKKNCGYCHDLSRWTPIAVDDNIITGIKAPWATSFAETIDVISISSSSFDTQAGFMQAAARPQSVTRPSVPHRDPEPKRDAPKMMLESHGDNSTFIKDKLEREEEAELKRIRDHEQKVKDISSRDEISMEDAEQKVRNEEMRKRKTILAHKNRQKKIDSIVKKRFERENELCLLRIEITRLEKQLKGMRGAKSETVERFKANIEEKTILLDTLNGERQVVWDRIATRLNERDGKIELPPVEPSPAQETSTPSPMDEEPWFTEADHVSGTVDTGDFADLM